MEPLVPMKQYQLTLEHRPAYLYVYVGSDVNNFEIARSYWIEILSLLHRRKYSRILIDKDVSQFLPAHDVFDLVSQLAHTGLAEISFAVFDRYYNRERCEFEQLVGTNRGLNIRIMPELKQAEKWLLAQHEVANVDIMPHVDELVFPRKTT